ncbi:tRNA (34-2'-O)-methyltransferase regulator WDR6 isoform X2 [Zootoca vivipara]|uniref:tRNA (34-2'-O)-methyltransferase regulator WDR6 isoform X2 n=1 Tax=Zootoca vivipara TaxID=8524 RepID=UPI00293B91FB|nr:tRNA (34-2'-O)-methyltransferase regulator WDR6 isoform X2 [Zootoca vivipara]
MLTLIWSSPTAALNNVYLPSQKAVYFYIHHLKLWNICSIYYCRHLPLLPQMSYVRGSESIGVFTSDPCSAMETELLLAPITALEIVDDHLVAGEGPYIAIYSLEPDASQSARCYKKVLRNHNVHGIKEQQDAAPGATTLAVFGGKGLVVLQLSFQGGTAKLAELFPFRELHDWIWDLQRLEAPGCVALALGHNSLALYDCAGQRTLREVHCQEKCILYSAHLVGSSWETLVLVAGTVFNQLVVWCAADPTDNAGRVKPRSRINGHKGVIFSICFSESKSILASASDDRSLRLWGVGDLRSPPDPVPCLLVCYGHQSRVWSVRLLSSYILSIGEDAACLVWNYQGEIVHRFKGHKGRGLRAVAAHERRGWVFTGGADSGIRQWLLKGQSDGGDSLVRLDFPSPRTKGSPRAVKLVDVNHLLVMTDAGAVYAYDLTSKAWALVLEDAAYRSYSLLEVSVLISGVMACAMGNLSGQVKVFPLCSPAESKELKLYEGKVHSLSWASYAGQDPGTCSLFVSGAAGSLLWLEVSLGPPEGVAVVVKRCFRLPLCKQRWHTCAAFMPRGELLLCGDRRGSLMLFECEPAQALSRGAGVGSSDPERVSGLPGPAFPLTGEEPLAEGPVSLLFGLHGKLGVTSITCHQDFIYSTGRDSCYRQLQVQGRQLRVLRKHRPCKGLDWLEELHFGPDGSVWVLGFHADRFVLWSASSNEMLLSVPCGGGHRSWSYAHCLQVGTFAYIKSGDVVVYQSQDAHSGQRILKESLHGRELTCVCHIGVLQAPGQEPVSTLATGSEDGTVNILTYRAQSRTVTQLTALGDHISSVRALAVAKDTQPKAGSISAILFSAGGRAQIECYRMLLSPSHSSGGGVVHQLVHVASHRLDEQWDHRKNRHKLVKMDPETRYMSIEVLAGVEYPELPVPLLFLAAACSDGSVRRHWLSSAATDGSIAFWDFTPTLNRAAEALKVEGTEMKLLGLGTPVLTIQAHSCGVNSLHIQQAAGGHFLVASGSDDGSISLSAVEVDAGSDADQEAIAGTGIRLLRNSSRLCAHAAHVTGVRLLQPDFLLSVSVDQRLALWHLHEDSLSFVGSKFCHVADAAGLECWEAGARNCHSVICGQGLEILRCSLDGPGAETENGV